MESNMLADMEVDNVAIYIYDKYQKYKSVELADHLFTIYYFMTVKRPFFYDFPMEVSGIGIDMALALVFNIILKILNY